MMRPGGGRRFHAPAAAPLTRFPTWFACLRAFFYAFLLPRDRRGGRDFLLRPGRGGGSKSRVSPSISLPPSRPPRCGLALPACLPGFLSVRNKMAAVAAALLLKRRTEAAAAVEAVRRSGGPARQHLWARRHYLSRQRPNPLSFTGKLRLRSRRCLHQSHLSPQSPGEGEGAREIAPAWVDSAGKETDGPP